MAIIDSVRKLAEKVGADTSGRTIADQLDLVNKKLDETVPGPRDISEAVGYFADSYSGGGGGETFEVEIISNDAETATCNKTYTEIISAINQGKQIAGNVTMNIPDTVAINSDIAYAYVTDVVLGYPGGTQTFNNAIYFTTNVIPPIAGITTRSMVLCGIILSETWEGMEILMFLKEIAY